MSSEIPFIRPSFPEPADLATEYAEIIESNWFTNFGPKEQQFRRAIEIYLGQGLGASTFGNGTLALLAALDATVGQGERDRVLLMPSFTFVAVAQAALWSGYVPHFIDVDADTWQASTSAARSVIERGDSDIAGIVLANAFGVGNPEVALWEELAAEYDLPLVIDSAAGFGSRYADEQHVGGRGTCEIFSFHATKPFAVGEGGALVSRDPEIVQKSHQFQNFGFHSGQQSVGLGINGKMSEFSAAIGLRQLPGLDSRLASRRRVLIRYQQELAGSGLRFQPNAERASLCFASALCESDDHKKAVLEHLAAAGVQARDYYNPPVHLHHYFMDNPRLSSSQDLSVTLDLCSRMVSLPIHDHMPSDDIDRVIGAAKVRAP